MHMDMGSRGGDMVEGEEDEAKDGGLLANFDGFQKLART